MRNCIYLFALTFLFFSCNGPSTQAPGGNASEPTDEMTSKPNILFVMADDLGKEWVSGYGAENIETPNIDRLAKEGLLFHNAWSMPQCTPTRATLLTGQYPFRHGWINHWDVPRWGAGCHFDPEQNMTFARIMRSAGYKTAIAGKWQINDFRIQPSVLDEHGFDDWCMWTGFEANNPPSAERYWDPYVHTRTGSKTYKGAFGEDVFSDFLIDFMKKNKDQPMMMYYPMAIPHGPLVTTPLEPDVKDPLDKHKAMVRYTDHIVGKLVKAIDELGIRKNTIIIWTTDNGTSGNIVGTLQGKELRGGKTKIGPSGTAMPFVANCPGLVPQGETDALVDFSDLLPTFAELGGAVIPQGLTIDGHSFAPLLTGKAKNGTREWVMAMGCCPAMLENGRVVPRETFFRRAVADKQYKMLIGPDRKGYAFYDLLADPFEEHNLIDAEENRIINARKKLEAVVATFPEKDGAPRYTPLAPQDWDVEASVFNIEKEYRNRK